MAKRKTYRVASPAIYRESDAARHLTPEQRKQLAGEAFSLSDSLRFPSAAVRAELSGKRRFPTAAKYWTTNDAKRLTNARPLKGESKSNAKARAKKAQSFFASEREITRRATHKTQWRVTLTGRVEITDKNGGTVAHNGTQFGPWKDVPVGGLTDDMIRQAYREVARFTVAVDARGRPQFQELHSKGFTEYRMKGKSQTAILYVEHSEVETREVEPGLAAEA